MAAASATSRSLVSIRGLLKKMIQAENFDKNFKNVEILSAENGRLSASMKVEKEHTNARGSLHGGLTASLVDALSGLGLLTYSPNIQSHGVSVSLEITYMSAAPLGKEILINTQSDKVGQKLAFLSVFIIDKESGKMIAKGTHVKYIAV